MLEKKFGNDPLVYTKFSRAFQAQMRKMDLTSI